MVLNRSFIYSPVASAKRQGGLATLCGEQLVRCLFQKGKIFVYYVYVLRSRKNEKQYIGYTGKTVAQRLKEHNCGANAFTKANRPFELIYFEEYGDKNFAIKRERFLKSGHGRIFLKQKAISGSR